MKKYSLIILIILIVLSGIIYFAIKKHISDTEGMKVTMLGGSTMADKGNVNSMGYIIRTKKNKLIIIDGGMPADADLVLEYINKYGKGKVDYWFVTHGHCDHIGALNELIESDENSIKIENLCYYFNSREWYEQYDKRGFEFENAFLNNLENSKIINKIECQKGQKIQIDNIECEILRIADPEVIHSDNGNDSSMCFKMTAKDVDKSILFLGDAYIYSTKELLQAPEKLEATAVQMSHHGQNGVSKEVYDNIKPQLCFFSVPEWLYNNDSGGGYNSGKWESIDVRRWVNDLGAENFLSYNGDVTVRFTSKGYHVIDD